MAWDNATAIQDFEDCQLDEFGESVVFVNGTNGNQTRIDAIRPTVSDKPLTLRGSTNTQARAQIELLISRGSRGKATIRQDVDKIRLRVNPDDQFDKTLTIGYVMNEYGAWRVGLRL